MHHHMMDEESPVMDLKKNESSNDHQFFGRNPIDQIENAPEQVVPQITEAQPPHDNAQFSNFLNQMNQVQRQSSPIQQREDVIEPQQIVESPAQVEEPQTMTDESGNNDGNGAEFKNALDTSIQNPTAESSM